MTLSLIKYLSRFALAGALIAITLMFAAPQWLSQKTGIPLWSQSGAQTTPQMPPANTFSYAQVLAPILPSVVRIYSQTSLPTQALALLQDPHYADLIDGQLFDAYAGSVGLGSGVIASHQGHILTNYHIIDKAARILVKLSDGRSAPARLVGADPATDLAVIQIDLEQLTPALVGSGADARVGDLVFAIGDPHGLGQSVSMGIISATGRNRMGLNTIESFIQTDAAINQGNSGGALVNARGELVGINTAQFSSSHGLALAIPISIVSTVLRSIVEHGRVVRGWLGIDFEALARIDYQTQAAQEFSPTLAQQGILLTGIYANSPAHQAGLQPGDRITHFDGQLIDDWNDSLAYVTNLAPGTQLQITYERKNSADNSLQSAQVTATLGSRPNAQ
jgi:serine protease DegS